MFEHAVLPPHSVFAHVLAVVRGVDHDRVVRNFAVRKRLEHAPELVVQPRGQTVIQLASLSNRLSININQIKAHPQVFVVQRERLQMALREDGHRHLAPIWVPVTLRNDEREVRSQIAGDQKERLVGSLALPEELHHAVSHLTVVIQDTGSVAGMEMLESAGDPILLSRQVVRVASSADAGFSALVRWRLKADLPETVAARLVVVHFAAQHRFVASIGHNPGDRGIVVAGESAAVAPCADPADVLAGCER